MKPPYFANRKPSVPLQLQQTPAGLVIPAPAYDLEVRIMFNTQTGNTQLQLHGTAKQFTTVQLAGLLSEHLTGVIRGFATNGLKFEPVKEGEDNGNQP